MDIGNKLVKWYENNKRDLPWRHTNDPFKIWLSEVILQQTRIEQGIPYYYKFIDQYSDVTALANAHQDELLKLWEGLGYYSRARNLHKAAQQIVTQHGGKIPSDYDELIKIAGIGPYTASAIASIAFNRPHAVIDGNVQRVISRLFCIDEPINSQQGKKLLNELAEMLLLKSNSGAYNQAIMELGATICKPQNPNCERCPLIAHCMAFERKAQHQYPKKEKKRKVRRRYFSYFVILTNNCVLLRKRSQGDIWMGLWEPVLLEHKNESGFETDIVCLKNTFKVSALEVLHETGLNQHLLTHQKIIYNIKMIYLTESFQAFYEYEKIHIRSIFDKAFPIFIKKFLKSPEIMILLDKYSD